MYRGPINEYIVLNDKKLLDAAANKNKWKTASLNRTAALC